MLNKILIEKFTQNNSYYLMLACKKYNKSKYIFNRTNIYYYFSNTYIILQF